jgi:hypothetical protein
LERFPAVTTTEDGTKVTLTHGVWLHVQFRHPEVGTNPTPLLAAVSKPDEVLMDERGGVHALKRVDQDHFLVVIYQQSSDEVGGGLIRTAFLINERRKNRRYRRAWQARRS